MNSTRRLHLARSNVAILGPNARRGINRYAFQENEIKNQTELLVEVDDKLKVERSKCDALEAAKVELEQKMKDSRSQFKDVEDSIRDKKASAVLLAIEWLTNCLLS